MQVFDKTKKLILAFQMRTGSNLLSSRLMGFGLNHGHEFFQEPIEHSREFWCKEYGIHASSRVDYLEQLIASARQQNVFVCKLAWNQKNALHEYLCKGNPWTDAQRARNAGSILERTLFKNASWVYVSRDDKAAQAVSLWKAFKTNCWTSLDKPRSGVDLSYDFQGIFRCYSLMIAEEHLWTEWFDKREINPLRVSYEDMNADLYGVLQKIITVLRLDAAITSDGVAVETVKLKSQTDSINTQYIDWFRKDLHHHTNRAHWNSVDTPWLRWLSAIEEEGG